MPLAAIVTFIQLLTSLPARIYITQLEKHFKFAYSLFSALTSKYDNKLAYFSIVAFFTSLFAPYYT